MKRINHDQRKQEIAEKAIRLFSQVGYDNVSLIMIAAAAGVSRTVLYRYFCSKREVLDAAIVFVTDSIEAKCTKIMASRAKNTEKLEGICHTVVDVMFKNKDFLVAVFDFVVGMARSGVSMGPSIGRFTTGTRTALRRLIEYAIDRHEIPEMLVVDRIADALYAQFEACAMRIVIGTESNAKDAKVRFSDIIRAISIWK